MDKKIVDNLLNLVKDNYQKIAEDFSATRRKEIWPEIRETAKEVKDGDSVLDVGCGNGRLLEAFKEKQIEYLGVDNSEALVSLAQGQYSYKFLVGDILSLNRIKAKDFDFVFCLAVLQHIPSRGLRVDALKQMKDKMKDDGKMIVSNWNLWKGKHRKMIYTFFLKKLLGKNKLEFGDITFYWKNSKAEKVSERYYHAFTKRELKLLAKKAGLKINKLYKDKYNYWIVLEK